MKKFIPYEKLSKRKQRELAIKQCGDWGGLNPVTGKPENLKDYNRKKAREWSEKLSMTVLFEFTIGCCRPFGAE